MENKSVTGLVDTGSRVWRAIAGEEYALWRFFRNRYRAIRSRIDKKHNGTNYVVFWSGRKRQNRIGIYMKGGCDLVSILYCQPLIHPILNGTCCIIREGLASDSRSDLLMQTLQNLPQEWVEPVIQRFKLPADYFQPRLFEPSVVVSGMDGPEEFPKRAVFLSIAPDVARTLYRHRRHGFLVDPGEWWINQPMKSVLSDLSAATWFNENFASVGKISVDEFRQNYSKIIRTLKNSTGARILVFNVLATEPGSQGRNYQSMKKYLNPRRREFNLALEDLSRELGFTIVDVDRILSEADLGPQSGSIQFPPEQEQPGTQVFFRIIAREAFHVMKGLGIY